MVQNNPSEKKPKYKFSEILEKSLRFSVRWFFMILLLSAAAFCVFVWYQYIFQADWDEARKQQYISEQAKFSFDKAGYQRMLEMMSTRKDKFENFPSFSGRDIFFPEGQ